MRPRHGPQTASDVGGRQALVEASMRQTTDTMRQTTDNEPETTCNRHHAADRQQKKTCNMQQTTCSRRQTTCGRQHAACDLRRRARTAGTDRPTDRDCATACAAVVRRKLTMGSLRTRPPRHVFDGTGAVGARVGTLANVCTSASTLRGANTAAPATARALLTRRAACSSASSTAQRHMRI